MRKTFVLRKSSAKTNSITKRNNPYMDIHKYRKIWLKVFVARWHKIKVWNGTRIEIPSNFMHSFSKKNFLGKNIECMFKCSSVFLTTKFEKKWMWLNGLCIFTEIYVINIVSAHVPEGLTHEIQGCPSSVERFSSHGKRLKCINWLEVLTGHQI